MKSEKVLTTPTKYDIIVFEILLILFGRIKYNFIMEVMIMKISKKKYPQLR